MRVTAIAPHPDDESLGCGGTLAKWADQGWDVSVLWMTERETEEERAEAQNALEALGVRSGSSLGLPAYGLSYDKKNLDALIAGLRRLRPQILLFPHAREDDRHHRTVHDLADEASWLAAYDDWPELGDPLATRPQLILEYEVWTPIERPTHVEDITISMERKLAALRAYRSELRHTHLVRAAEGLNRYRAASAGTGEYAEAFRVRVYGGSLTSLIGPR